MGTKRTMSTDCERCNATASRSESSMSTNWFFANSQPLTSSSASTSRSWKGQYRFCLIGVPHSRCSVRKAVSLRCCATASPIGMLTRPKLMDPFQMVRMGRLRRVAEDRIVSGFEAESLYEFQPLSTLGTRLGTGGFLTTAQALHIELELTNHP